MIRFNDPHATGLISRHSRVPFIKDYHTTIARYDRRDMLMGGVMYTDFNHASIQLHIAAFQPNWVNREMLWVCFNYPFCKLGVNKLIGLVPENNKAAIVFDLHLGFVVEHTVRDVFPGGEGMVVLGMYAEQCRFLKMRRPQLTLESNREWESRPPKLTTAA